MNGHSFLVPPYKVRLEAILLGYILPSLHDGFATLWMSFMKAFFTYVLVCTMIDINASQCYTVLGSNEKKIGIVSNC